MFLTSTYSLFRSGLFVHSSVCRRFYRPKAGYSVSSPIRRPKPTSISQGTSSDEFNFPSPHDRGNKNSNEPPLPSHLFLATSGSSFYFPPDRNHQKSSTGEGNQSPNKMHPIKEVEDKENTVWVRGPIRSFPVDVSTPPLTSEEIERWKLDRLLLGKALLFDMDKPTPKFLVPPNEKIFSLGPEMDKIDELYRRKGRYTPSEVAHAFFPVIPSFYVELRHVFQALPPSIAYRMEQDLGSRGLGANFFAGYPMLFHQRRPSHQKSAVKLNSDFWFVVCHPFFKKADRFQYKNNSDYKAHIGGVVHKNAPVGQGVPSTGVGGKDIDLHIFDILARHIGWKVIKKLVQSKAFGGVGEEEEKPVAGTLPNSKETTSGSTSPIIMDCFEPREKAGNKKELGVSGIEKDSSPITMEEWAYQPVPLIPWMNSLSRNDMAVVQQVPEKRIILLLSKYVRVFQLLCGHGEDPLLYTDRQNLRHLFPTTAHSTPPTTPGVTPRTPSLDRPSQRTTAVGTQRSGRSETEFEKEKLQEENEEEESTTKRQGDSEMESKQIQGDPLEVSSSSTSSSSSDPPSFPLSSASMTQSNGNVSSTEEAREGEDRAVFESATAARSTPIKGNYFVDDDLLGLDEILSGSEKESTPLMDSPLMEKEGDERDNGTESQSSGIKGESQGIEDDELDSMDEEEEDGEDGGLSTSADAPKSAPSRSSSSPSSLHSSSNAEGGEDLASGYSLPIPSRLDILLVRRLPSHVSPRSLSNCNGIITPLPEVTSLAASFLAPPPSLRHDLQNFFTLSRKRHKHQNRAVAIHGSDIWRWTPVQIIYEALSKKQKKDLRAFRGLTNYLRLHGELFEVSADLMHVIAHDPKGVVSPFLPHQKIFSFEERVVLPMEPQESSSEIDEGKTTTSVSTSNAEGGGRACMIGEKERKLFNDLLGDSQIPTTRKQIALLDPENPVLNNDILYEEISRLLPRHPVRKREVLAKLPPILRAAVPTRGLFLHNCSPHIAVFYEKGETMIQRKEDFQAASTMSSSRRLLPGEETTISAEQAIEEVRQSIPEGGATVKALRVMYLSSEVVNSLMQHYGSIIRGLEAFPQYFNVDRREGMPTSDSFVKLR